MKHFALLAPFLFVLASLLQLNYVALIVASPAQLLRPLLVLWVILLILLVFTRRVLGDWNWAALLLTVIVAGLCFSTPFFSTVLLFTVALGLLWWLFMRFKKAKIHAAGILSFLSGVSLIFIGYTVLLIGDVLAAVPWGKYRESIWAAENFSLAAAPAVKRDIYYIVLDGYARVDVLENLYGFDNAEFVTSLQQQGFLMPAEPVSNYPATHLSVASLLNMDYIPEFAPGLEKSYQRWLLSPFIDHSRVRALLEGQGYKTVSLSTNWSITDNASTDFYYQPYPVMLNDFEGFLLDSTPLKMFEPILSGIASVPTFESQRRIILYNFETLAQLPKLPGPKFVFAHIIAPHPPFVFDKNGDPVDTSGNFSFKDAAEYGGSREEYRQRYADQLQFVNDRIAGVIYAILAGSAIQPIIIIQADHGPGLFVDFASAKDTCVWERFSPFAAYYLPGLEPDVIPPDISSVNVFRIVFNEYFDTELPLLETRQYFYGKPVSFYEFEDVTARQNEKCEQP